MRKQSTKQKLRQIRRAAQRLVAKAKRRLRGRTDPGALPLRPRSVEYEQEGRLQNVIALPIAVPPRLSIEANYEEVAAWLARLRDALAKGASDYQNRRQLSLPLNAPTLPRRFHDFALIKELTPATALLIASEYDKWQTFLGAKLGVYNRRRWRKPVRELLDDIGFFDLLGIELARPPRKRKAGFVRMSRHESGDRVDPKRISEFVNQLLATLLKVDSRALTESARRLQTMQLVVALIEATENTRLHAYAPTTREDPKQAPKWWIAGAIYPHEGKLTLIVCDHGVSIPGSLEGVNKKEGANAPWVSRVTQRFFTMRKTASATISDHVSIRLAMNYGSSSTGRRHRGKGLPAIREVVQHCREGRLLVLSRFGEYRYRKGMRPQARELPAELPGTLIVWDLTL